MEEYDFINRMQHICEWMSLLIATKYQAKYIDPEIQELGEFLESMPSTEKIINGTYKSPPNVRDLLHEQFLFDLKIKASFEHLYEQLCKAKRHACVCRCLFEANGNTNQIGVNNLHIDILADQIDKSFKTQVGANNLIRLATTLGIYTEEMDINHIYSIFTFLRTPPEESFSPRIFWEIQNIIQREKEAPLPFEIFENEIQSVAWLVDNNKSYNTFAWIAIDNEE